jgi:hypothetical protein
LDEDRLVDFISHGKFGRLVLEAVADGTGVVNEHRVSIGTTVKVRVVKVNRASGRGIHDRDGGRAHSGVNL